MKLVQVLDSDSGPGLYDLEKDIGETTNLASEMPSLVNKLEARWREWSRTNKPTFYPTLSEDKWWERNLNPSGEKEE